MIYTFQYEQPLRGNTKNLFTGQGYPLAYERAATISVVPDTGQSWGTRPEVHRP